MGLLVGLPLKLFALLFTLLRLALPVLVILVALWVLRGIMRDRNSHTQYTQQKAREPDFKGPVYTVDYEEVDEDKP